MGLGMKRRRQAYKQAPWRVQVLTTSRTALWLVVLLVLAGIYLAVNAKVARAGREVLVLESKREDLQRENAELTAVLAEFTAPERMMERAASMGFRRATSMDIDYLPVERYQPEQDFIAPRPPGSSGRGERMLSPAYTETLGEWITRWLNGSEDS